MRVGRQPALARARRGRRLRDLGRPGCSAQLAAQPPARRRGRASSRTPAARSHAHPWLERFEVVRGAGRGRAVAARSGCSPSRPGWPAAARRAGVDVAPPPRRHDPAAPGHAGDRHDPRPPAPRLSRSTSRPSSAPTCGSACGPSVASRPAGHRGQRVHARRRRRAASTSPDDRVVRHPAGRRPRPAPPAAITADAVARGATGSTGRWFLYPAITYPHKNHATLVRALAERARHDALLVLTGGAGSAEAPLARAGRATSGVADRVRRPAACPSPTSTRLYRGAVACVFPSRYEAVGLPVLEAMARAARSWPPTPPPCPTWSATPATWSTPTTPPRGRRRCDGCSTTTRIAGPSSSPPVGSGCGRGRRPRRPARLVEAWRAGAP